MKKYKNVVIIFLVLALLILPFIVTSKGEFEGADQKALEIVKEIDPNYKPVAESIFIPASGEIESMLFVLQGVIGASFIGYYVGSKRKTRKNKPNTGV